MFPYNKHKEYRNREIICGKYKKKRGGGEKNIFFQLNSTIFYSSLFFNVLLFFSMEKTHKSGNGGGREEGRVYKRKKETLKWTGLTEVTNGPVTRIELWHRLWETQ